MTTKSSMLSILGLAVAGTLAVGSTGASAQTFYVEEPYVPSYPVVVAPGSAYVVPPPLVAPPPIVRERIVVIRRPGYAPAPVFGAPVPRYDYMDDGGYIVAGW